MMNCDLCGKTKDDFARCASAHKLCLHWLHAIGLRKTTAPEPKRVRRRALITPKQ
jgi:hypothetical protein